MAEFVLYSVDFYTFDVKPVTRYIVESAPTLCEIIADVIVHQHAIHGPDVSGPDDIVIDMYPPSTRVTKLMMQVKDVLTNDVPIAVEKLRPLLQSSISIMVDAPESEHYFLLCTKTEPTSNLNQLTINL